MAKLNEEQQQTRQELLKLLKPGDTIYTITRHVSRSGMMRRISAFIVDNGKIREIDWYIERMGIAKRRKGSDGLTIEGCGMDMHFWLVYEIGSVLFPDGFKLAKNQYGRNGDTSGYDKDGGYAFNKESL